MSDECAYFIISSNKTWCATIYQVWVSAIVNIYGIKNAIILEKKYSDKGITIWHCLFQCTKKNLNQTQSHFFKEWSKIEHDSFSTVIAMFEVMSGINYIFPNESKILWNHLRYPLLSFDMNILVKRYQMITQVIPQISVTCSVRLDEAFDPCKNPWLPEFVANLFMWQALCADKKPGTYLHGHCFEEESLYKMFDVIGISKREICMGSNTSGFSILDGFNHDLHRIVIFKIDAKLSKQDKKDIIEIFSSQQKAKKWNGMVITFDPSGSMLKDPEEKTLVRQYYDEIDMRRPILESVTNWILRSFGKGKKVPEDVMIKISMNLDRFKNLSPYIDDYPSIHDLF